MIQGNGTMESPLIASKTQLMDISIFHAQEDKQPKVALFVDIGDELHLLAFDLEDFKEIIDRSVSLIEELDV